MRRYADHAQETANIGAHFKTFADIAALWGEQGPDSDRLDVMLSVTECLNLAHRVISL